MAGIDGFRENYGRDLHVKDYVMRVLSDTAKLLCYEQIQVPVVERASSYSEEVVGKSPWPEWNNKGCFFFEIDDYFETYNEEPKKERVLLIPEGTISVTRWLGEQMNRGVRFPLKMFYALNCYRNELISTLSATKGREFSQFGLEILGSENPHSDIEILCVISHSLMKLGIKPEEIRFRINDITIFNKLISECALEDESVELKELLDTLAEVKAGKGVERKTETENNINAILDKNKITGENREKWTCIIEQQDYELDRISEVLGKEYSQKIESLKEICDAFAKNGIHVVADLCVIRSHEYYTSLSYEIDVLTAENKYIEIAGGGRYDRLVSNFVPKDCKTKKIPCTGFAFGIERVISMLEQEKRLPEKISINSLFCFGEDQARCIIPENESTVAYIKEFTEAIKQSDPFYIEL